jgi:hypothetical protein
LLPTLVKYSNFISNHTESLEKRFLDLSCRPAALRLASYDKMGVSFCLLTPPPFREFVKIAGICDSSIAR